MQRVTLPVTFRMLASNVRTCLTAAADEGVLRTPPEDIFRLLKTQERAPEPGTTVLAVFGGATFDKGQSDDAFFIRSDGSRLSFAVSVAYQRASEPVIVAYRFHLRFPSNSSPAFIRVDLNDESREPLMEPRSHLHPGSDRIRLPLPMMTPLEILERLLYGTPTP